MKILLMGDASNYHATLALGLAQLGHQVTVASHGSRWMGTQRDIDLSRREGKIGGLVLWLKFQGLLSKDLRGYDIVHISNPNFVELKPQRIKDVFDKLKRYNGKVLLTALGMDSFYVKQCVNPNGPLKYNEFRVAGNPTPYALTHQQIENQWRGKLLSDHCKYVYDNIDGVVTALYEYHKICQSFVPADHLAYGGIPVSIEQEVKAQKLEDEPLRIFAACHKGREAEKGMDLMLPVLERFARKHEDNVIFDLVQNVPIDEFKLLLSKSHIVVDQLYSYTPATTALMAMAQGKVVVSGAEPEYLKFIGERQSDFLPIINPDPLAVERLENELELLLHDRERFAKMAATGPAFVAKHNSPVVVAQRFNDLWERIS